MHKNLGDAAGGTLTAGVGPRKKRFGAVLALLAVLGLLVLTGCSDFADPTANQLRAQKAAATAQDLEVNRYAHLDQPDGKLLTGYVLVTGDKSARNAEGSKISSRLYFQEVSTDNWIFGCKLADGTMVSLKVQWLNERYWSANPGCPQPLVLPTPAG